MEKSKGPAGYPGDEAIKKAFGEAVRALRIERGLSPQELVANIRANMRKDRHEFLAKAMALTVRRIRKLRKMTCRELSDVSGLPLKFILSIEHAKTKNLVLTDIFRLSMAMKYPTPEFAQEIVDLEKSLECRAKGTVSTDKALKLCSRRYSNKSQVSSPRCFPNKREHSSRCAPHRSHKE